MILEYRFSSRQRKKYIFLPLVKQLTVIVIATIIGVVWFSVVKEQLLVVIGLTWAWIFLMHILPILIMAIRHSQLSRHSYFAIDTVNSTYHYHEKDLSVSFRLTEIDKVIKVVSPPKYDKRIDFLGFGYFFYWKIMLVDSRTLSISCMLLDVDDFPGKEITQEKRVFPVPPSNQGLS
jgi:hypothetical protein